jgi:hypothetical protein
MARVFTELSGIALAHRSADQPAAKPMEVSGGGHDDPVVGCMACRFDRQVFCIKIEPV